jgi:hypothetical protein
MCCSVSASFLVFSLIALIAVFTLTLLNMLFSILTPKEYESFIMVRVSAAYSSPVSLSMLDNLKKVDSNDKISENIRVLKEISLIEKYSADKIEELNDDVQKHKTILMAFGIASFAELIGFIFFFVPIYTTSNCGANCSQQCDCNCDCYLCLGVTPIKRIILFYTVNCPIVFFTIVCFFITLAKKVTYSSISSMKDIKEYMNRKKSDSYYHRNEYEYDYFGDSVSYNDAQFVVYLILIIVLVIYPLVVWLTSSEEEMNPPIIPYQKKVKNTNITELTVGLNVNSTNRKVEDCSYNSHPPQPQYQPPPPQPRYQPPPPQPHYRPPPPQPHYAPPPPQPHYNPPAVRPAVHINIPIPRINIPSKVVFSSKVNLI